MLSIQLINILMNLCLIAMNVEFLRSKMKYRPVHVIAICIHVTIVIFFACQIAQNSVVE